MEAAVEQLLKLSPPVLLAVFLNVIGFSLKKVPWLPGWSIPLLLIAAGAGMFPYIADQASVSYQVENPAVFNGIIGGCIGGLAVGLHQAVSGFMKRNGGSDRTREGGP